ncbi:hypothetical protein PybrP1_007206 [[Pythium] brassicae (nom. inval.)]|nr:hypothetical protein PybrP1_007206 [[Pythium] brassicae (nom. inval.)]
METQPSSPASAPPNASVELPARLGRVQALQEHFQASTPHGALTKALFDGVRGCCFSVHLQDPTAIIRGSKSFSASASSVALLRLVFRNYYAAVLRVVQVNRDGSFAVLLEQHPLMLHAHCEDDAQNWHVVPLDKVRRRQKLAFFGCARAGLRCSSIRSLELTDVAGLFGRRLRVLPVCCGPRQANLSTLESFCVYLFQPSPLWEKWEVQGLKLFWQAKPAAQPQPSALLAGVGSGDDRRSSITMSAGLNETSAQGVGGVTATTTTVSKEERLTKRPSRTGLMAYIESKDVQESAAECLSLVARLRALLHPSS